jgi:hypothetical protein
VARIYYYEDNLVPVSVWSAVYDPDANTITVNWTNPTTDFTRAEAFYTVEGGGTTSLSVTNATTPGGAASAKIYGVPRQDVSGVQNGTPVSGGRRHDITIQAYSDTNQMDTIFKIWNFGTPEDTGSGMSVSNVYPAEEISTQAQLAAMALNNANKKYVLVNDIDLTGTWSPKGTGSGSNTFKGTFYGNGHTISGLKLSSVAITGLFGSIDGAVIRDLKVVVADTAPLSGNIQYFGGIVGYVTGSTLTNLIVEVPSGCFLGFTTTNNSMTFAGGIAGYVTNTTINNCRTAGAGTLKTATPVSGYSGATLRTGGIAGSLGGESGIQDCSVSLAIQVEGYGLSTELSGAGIVAALETSGSTLDYAVSRCRVSGDVSVTAGSNASIFAGGAVGRCSNPSLIDNLSVSGTLTMSKGALGGYNYCGGIIGNNGSTSIDACEFSGRIVIPDTFAASTTSYIGGIAGYYYTISGTSPTIGNCAARGTMYIQSRGSGQVNIGGVLGYVEGVSGDPVNVENCRYEDGDITALRTEGSGGFSVGGFAGSVGSNSIFSNCRSLAGNVSAHSYDFIYIGGFAGLLTGAAIDGCYALTDVSSTGSSTQFTGGLIGNATNNSTISRCYAAGSVRAVSTADGVTFYTGGLVGNVANTSVSDSYALGNVLADKTAGNGAVNAGGLAGNFSTTGRIIERCFSAGTVTARSAGSGIIYAGGLVAQGGTGTILKNNAALGASVTAQGPGTKNIGRVYGTWTSGTISNNHAVSTMLLFSDAYNKPYPAEATPAPASNAAGKDGADVADGSLRGQAFWTDAPSTGLGFTAGAANWNFNSVYARRYPALEGLGG